MLAVARQSIAAGLRRERLSVEPLNPHLAELRGAFTTLHIRRRLRGCVGFILPQYPLYLTIVETARAAAFSDPRFSPLSAEEFPLLTLEISVLSVMTPMITPFSIIGDTHSRCRSGRIPASSTSVSATHLNISASSA